MIFLQVVVKGAKKLPAKDIATGKSDSFLELTNDGEQVEKTRVISNNLNPVCGIMHRMRVGLPAWH